MASSTGMEVGILTKEKVARRGDFRVPHNFQGKTRRNSEMHAKLVVTVQQEAGKLRMFVDDMQTTAA